MSKHIHRWKNSSTQEQRAEVEADVLNMLNKLIDMELSVDLVQQGSHPEMHELNDFYVQYYYLVKANIVKFQSLISLFMNYFNTQQFALQQLLGKIKRIKQKQASLNLWTDEANYSFTDKFLNLDYIDTEVSNLNKCFVDTIQGVVTLPQTSTYKVNIKKVAIGSKSTGQPGNSNLDVSFNQNPNALLSGKLFEYERLDTGACVLVLLFDFNKNEIINNIKVRPEFINASNRFNIGNIEFYKNGVLSKSISQLTSKHTDKDFYTLKSSMQGEDWSVSFLPVEASRVVIRFESNDYSVIQSGRKRYSISLSNVEFNRNTYSSLGTLSSNEIAIPNNLYSGIFVADTYPLNSDLYSLDIEISKDGGETWLKDDNTLAEISSTFLLEGEAQSLIWRIALQRNDLAFKNSSELAKTESLLKVSDSILRTGSRENSPLEVRLPDIPANAEVFAVQPNLMGRGSKGRAVKAGEGKNNSVTLLMPLELLNKRQYDNFNLYVNNVRFEQVTANPGANEFAFNDDYTEIILSDEVKVNSDIRFGLNYEKLFFVETADGFMAETDFLIDPEKSKIDLEYISKEKEYYTQILPRDELRIKLSTENIIASSFSLTSTTGDSFVETSTRSGLIGQTNYYYVDYKKGWIEFSTVLGSKNVRAMYQGYKLIKLAPTSFDVLMGGSGPKFINVNKSNFLTTEQEDIISDLPGVLPNILTGISGRRDNFLSNNNLSKVLSYDFIVPGTLNVPDDLLVNMMVPQEVPFVDGTSEFIGLIEVTDETVPQLEGDVDGKITFSLSARDLWYPEFGVIFSNKQIFADQYTSLTDLTSPGDYYVSPDGEVTLQWDPFTIIPSGINISYYYRDISYTRENKYSVDYKKGIIYAGSNLNQSARIVYKAANYRIGYNVCKMLPIAYNKETNIVSVQTETLAEINNTVRVFWGTASNTENLEALTNYFSPIINSVSLRAY